jgi:hypothetical protein
VTKNLKASYGTENGDLAPSADPCNPWLGEQKQTGGYYYEDYCCWCDGHYWKRSGEAS